MGSRLLLLTLLLLIVILVFGWISIDSQFYALETDVDHAGRMDVAQARYKLQQPVVVEAELLPEGRNVLLVPQYNDIIVRDGKSVIPLEGSVGFEDGKYTYWGDMRPKRVWVFMVISKDKPKITVAE
jgi:hypothetical protein